MNSSSSLTRIHTPWRDTLVISAEVFVPSADELIAVRLDKSLYGLQLCPPKPIVSSQFDFWLEPEFRFSFGCDNVNVFPTLLSGEEKEAKTIFS
jgi:hypothetical protein